MTLLLRSRLLVNFAINTFPKIILKNVEVQIIPQRIFSALSIPKYQDKFSIGQRKRKSRKNSGQLRKTPTSLDQSEVFQLDPLKGEDAPDIPDTIKQRTRSDTLLGVVQDVLNGPELSPVLSPILGDFQVEITQVKITRDLRNAAIFWTVSDELKGNEENVQNLLFENKDHIRRLLPAYSTLKRLPQLVFIQDKKGEYEKEVESLIQAAKHADSCTSYIR
ncbi:hypothetical protein OS493_036343 [Desmophyllum pertusum]|uniref:Ribosome-binding factor A n=1 Tax=Desmophyllum pertusum TaxID=174260 RepID=A0A9W9YIH5_9CNID|nr:hypothetical protein OS493_036343 [Desmophyllum pertusum]